MARKTIEHYEITRKLGAGGSGVVFLANDTRLQRPVVLKILRAGLLTVEQMRSTVLREARLASAIEVGLCWVNSWFLRDLRTPFGGSKQSGIGREGGLHSLEFYTELRNVMVKY